MTLHVDRSSTWTLSMLLNSFILKYKTKTTVVGYRNSITSPRCLKIYIEMPKQYFISFHLSSTISVSIALACQLTRCAACKLGTFYQVLFIPWYLILVTVHLPLVQHMHCIQMTNGSLSMGWAIVIAKGGGRGISP